MRSVAIKGPRNGIKLRMKATNPGLGKRQAKQTGEEPDENPGCNAHCRSQQHIDANFGGCSFTGAQEGNHGLLIVQPINPAAKRVNFSETQEHIDQSDQPEAEYIAQLQ